MTDRAATELRIRALAHGGEGVGEAFDPSGGPVWFVPGTLPGETVVAEVEHTAKRWIRGRLLDVVEPCPERVAPPCPLADPCGGCSWQHVAPAAQAGFKRAIVASAFRGRVDPAQIVDGFAGASLGYRRRVRMHYTRSEHGLKLGFYEARSRRLLDVPHCPILVPVLERAIGRLREVPAVLLDAGEVLGLTDGEEAVLGLPGLKPDPERLAALATLLGPGLRGISVRGGRRRGEVGQPYLMLDGGGGLPAVRADPYSFSQSQTPGNRSLVRHVMARARPDGKRILELFAGAGNLTRGLARTAARVWASDTDHDAIATLRQLAETSGLPINAKRQTASALLERLAAAKTTYDVIVVDPPRAGLGKAAMAAACRVATERIVYVSCDPATLARDLEVARERGYDIAEIAVFDLMPMTPEIEVVATLIARRANVP